MEEYYGLDLHGQLILDEYRERLPVYRILQEVAVRQLSDMMAQCGITLNFMESRLKEEASLAGKLRRKGSKYQKLSDITDIFGARIIAFYNEDVDRIASMAETLFEIDWANSVDKRKMHQVTSFGYNSLHYICRIPPTLFCDPSHPELNELYFELQMRTALQHVWSAIQHDIGYKTDIETPNEYHRDLGRLAGMLELADMEFSRIRTSIANYRRRVQRLVQSHQLEEVQLDGDTFRSYLDLRPFDKLNQQIAAITQAELHPAPLMPYLKVLKTMKMQTLGDVERMMQQNYEDAYQLALYQLGSTDIDILAETIGLQNLCVVYILKAGGGWLGVKTVFDMVNGANPNNEIMAKMIAEQAQRLSFMNK